MTKKPRCPRRQCQRPLLLFWRRCPSSKPWLKICNNKQFVNEIDGQNIIHQHTLRYSRMSRIFDQSQRSSRSTTSATGTRTDQFQVSKKLNSYKGVLDFLIHTYVQKLHTIAKQAFSDWRNLNLPHGRFASEVSKAKHQLDYSLISNHLCTTTLSLSLLSTCGRLRPQRIMFLLFFVAGFAGPKTMVQHPPTRPAPPTHPLSFHLLLPPNNS